MFKLYARKGAGSVAVEAVLAVCGANYAVEDLQREADGWFPAEFRRLNPRAEVPTLVLPDDSIMTESSAIIIHLADIFPAAGLAPALTSPLRPRYLRWMLFLATTAYMSDLRLFYPERYTIDPAGTAGIKAKAAEGVAAEFAMLSEALGAGPFMLGAKMSALDIYAAMLINWAPDVSALFAKHPNIETLYERVSIEPVIAKVWARNEM